MLKIALIRINKHRTNEELRELHRCIDAGTAEVQAIPSVGQEFSTVEHPAIVLYCLRVDDSRTTKIFPHPFEGHDATVYAYKAST